MTGTRRRLGPWAHGCCAREMSSTKLERSAVGRTEVGATSNHRPGASASHRFMRPRPGRRNGRDKLEASTAAGCAALGGKRPSTIRDGRRQRAGSASKAERRRRRTSGWSPDTGQQPRTRGSGLSGCPGARSWLSLRAVSPVGFRSAGRGRGRVAVAHGDLPGAQLGADPADRHMSERGKRRGGARRARVGREADRRPGAGARGAGGRPRDQAFALVRAGADLRGDRLTGLDRRLRGFG